MTPLVRVPWNEPGIIGKTLDAGARGVIIPMVNSVAEAEQAVRACRYAPAGARSYGPLRANYYAGSDYFEHANDDVLCIVMIETKEAVARVDEILSVPGIDAVYVGPADLSVTLGLPPAPDQVAASLQRRARARRRVVSGARRRARDRGQSEDRAQAHRARLPARRGRGRRRAARHRARGRRCKRPRPITRRRRDRRTSDGGARRIVSAVAWVAARLEQFGDWDARHRRLRRSDPASSPTRSRRGRPARQLARARRRRDPRARAAPPRHQHDQRRLRPHRPRGRAAQREITVTHTPVLSDAVADLTLGLIAMVARRLGEAVADIGRAVAGATACSAPTCVARPSSSSGSAASAAKSPARALALQDACLRVRRPRRGSRRCRASSGSATLAEGLDRADFVSLHVDLNPSTRHLLDDAAFALMKPTAIVINTSRGGVDRSGRAHRARSSRIGSRARASTCSRPNHLRRRTVALDAQRRRAAAHRFGHHRDARRDARLRDRQPRRVLARRAATRCRPNRRLRAASLDHSPDSVSLTARSQVVGECPPLSTRRMDMRTFMRLAVVIVCVAAGAAIGMTASAWASGGSAPKGPIPAGRPCTTRDRSVGSV